MITPDRLVTRLDQAVDTTSSIKLKSVIDKHTDTITAISAALSNGAITKKNILDWCKTHSGVGSRKVAKVLEMFCIEADMEMVDRDLPAIWLKSKGDKNSHIYTIIEPDA